MARQLQILTAAGLAAILLSGGCAEPTRSGGDADADLDHDGPIDGDLDGTIDGDLDAGHQDEPDVISFCGDGSLDEGEACDDGNNDDGDGCAADCSAVEEGWRCPEPGEPCVPPFIVRAPAGTVAFMLGQTCPEGWLPLERARGRMLLGVANGTTVGETGGEALAAGEPLTHTHDYATELSVRSAGIAGISGCCNENPGLSGTYLVSGTTELSEDVVPRLQQLLCEREDDDQDLADGHPFPEGTIMFFNRPSCPTGWLAVSEADGRFIVPTPTGGTPGDVVGEPLMSGERLSHSHRYHAALEIPECSLAALGGGNSDPAHDGTHPFEGTTNNATAEPPFLRLLVCRARAQNPLPEDREVFDDPIPPGTVGFFESPSCPGRWSPSAVHHGRFLVGLMGDGLPLELAGGEPLEPGEDRPHTHEIRDAVSIPIRSVALASGCCYDDTGCAGEYPFSTVTEPASSNIPYISFLVCTKD